ncbi:MAG: hypothetical protein AB9880_11990 [Christensenellales bacterium]
MKKALIRVLALMMALLLPGAALAAGKLTLLQETFVVLPTEGYHEGVVYAEVGNAGDKPVAFNSGLFELYDKDGATLDSLDLDYYDCNPEVLQPGETGFFRASIPVEAATDAATIADHTLNILGTGTLDTVVTRFSVLAAYKREMEDGVPHDYIIAIIGNDTDESIFDFYVTYALKDAQGKLLYTTVNTYSYVGLMPHAATQLRVEVRENAVAWMDEQGLVPLTAEAIAFTSLSK